MYSLIILWPLIGAGVAGLGGRWVGEEGAVRVTTGLLGTTAIASIYALYEVGIKGNNVYVKWGKWIESDLLEVDWGLMYDSLTVVMLVVVTVVSTLVHMYSGEYMRGDPHRPRFMSYLSLFTFFMLILVTADNFVQMFVGWEGVGLCSYLLINFWFTRIQANKAAIQAMLVNRVGDVGLALGIMGIFYEFRAVDYETVMAVSPQGTGLTLIGILLFVGAVGKSAQIGLHVWLPNAMEGPTPVSALIHAATMVTAGVFLLARTSGLIEYAEGVKEVVVIMGAMTAIFAATTGLVQNDIKKVIAYSTASQLGYMVFACGLSAYTVGVFHLANHAFFKALLFLSAGAVIHGMSDEQDIRRMGGLVRILPYTYGMIFIGSMALMGFPFLTGFYSKDVILEVASAKYSEIGKWAQILGSLAAFCTAFYSIRLLHLTFLSKAAGYKVVVEKAHEPGLEMLIPLFILCLGSIFAGYLGREMFIGVGTDFWGNAVFTHPKNMVMVEAEFLPIETKWKPTILGMLGAVLAGLWYTGNNKEVFKMKVTSVGRRLYKFLNRKWYFDKLYNEWIGQVVLEYGHRITYKGIDKGVLHMLGPDGITKVLYKEAEGLSRMQSGYLNHYIIVMFMGVVLMYILTWL